jgi:hypothetical protein
MWNSAHNVDKIVDKLRKSSEKFSFPDKIKGLNVDNS